MEVRSGDTVTALGVDGVVLKRMGDYVYIAYRMPLKTSHVICYDLWVHVRNVTHIYRRSNKDTVL